MAIKFIVFFGLLALAKAGGIVTPLSYATPIGHVTSPLLTKIVNPSVDAVASTQQNVVRSFGGTVSTYSKAVDTPYSSVRKTDTRINNNVYAPALAKTVTYAAPLASIHHAPSHSEAIYGVPAGAKAHYAATAVYSAPAVTKTIYAQQSPVVYSHAAPTLAKSVTYGSPVATTNVNHGPAATTYTHNAPGVSSYGTSQTVHYSPAEMVSHMSFDGFGTHWGF